MAQMKTATSELDDSSPTRGQARGYVLIAIVYLLGLFMGALDTGIVTPCRTIVQTQMGVSDQLGVWMITIYTLAYAASIPVMGKLADKYGRKYIYLMSILLFGTGSLLCGLSQNFGNFTTLLIARAIQALGGGGIMPVATAEFGTAFPEDKRGLALGLVGGVYGIANVFGASAGSLILNIFGQQNWQFIFYVNIPISLFIIIAGFICLPNTKEHDVKPIDGWGICVLTVMILSLLYGLKNLDFFAIPTSITSTDVYPFLLLSLAMMPLFVFVEHRACDPVMNLSYFKDRDILLTLLLSIITGIVLMGIIFIPQFAENALRLPSGDGGYFVIILGIFAGVGAPVSGKLIDRFGSKLILGFGFACSIIGSLYLAFVTCPHPNLPNVIVCLVFLGLGIGFTMGTPLNYMMLEKTDPKESNSSLATLSLVRSIGTAVAPAIMVAFIAHAGANVQGRIMDALPDEVSVSPLPYAQELTDDFNTLKADENTKDMLDGINMPDLAGMQTVQVEMNSDSDKYSVPDDLVKMMQGSDVTTITDNTKAFASAMFAMITPDLLADIDSGIDSGTQGMTTAKDDMDDTLVQMQDAYDELGSAIDEMDSAVSAQEEALSQMEEYLPMLEQVENRTGVLDLIPQSAKDAMPQTAIDQLADVSTAADLQSKIDELASTISSMQAAHDGIETGITQMQASLSQLETQISDDEAALAKATDPAQIAALEGKLAGERSGADSLKEQIGESQGKASGMSSAIEAQQSAMTMMQEYLPVLEQLDSYNSVLDIMPDSAKAAMPSSVLDELSSVKTADDLEAKMAELRSAIAEVQQAQDEMRSAQSGIKEGIDGIKGAQGDVDTTLSRMAVLKAAVSGSFQEADQNYQQAIDNKSDEIETIFQETLNKGFKGMFELVAICAAIGIVMLLFYREGPHNVPASRTAN